MQTSVRTAAKPEPEEPSWAVLLSRCIDAIGGDQFHADMVDALKSLADFDNSVVFAYYKEEKPICLDHTFTAKQRVVYVDDYLKGPYLLDPFFKACRRKMESGLYRLRDIAPDRFYQSEYYRSYYVRTGLAEELCYIFYLPAGVAVVISLMRLKTRSKFSAREFKILESVSPVITSLARQHWKNIPDSFRDESDSDVSLEDHSLIEKAVGDSFGNRLTPREVQVVSQVLEGHSSESIAGSLGISTGTVRIHRRNIYGKLQVSSQQELFSIFFKKITTVHD